jgi:hypothetical protein
MQVLQPKLVPPAGIGTECLPLSLPNAHLDLMFQQPENVTAICFGHNPYVPPVRCASGLSPAVCLHAGWFFPILHAL